MSRSRFTLLLWVSSQNWELFSAENVDQSLWTSKSGESIATKAQELKAVLDSERLVGMPMVVALESKDCLASSFQAASPKQTRNITSLTYQLEEFLPIAAEEVVADFVVQGTEVLGICCEKKWLSALLGQLAMIEADVRGVVPAVLLATSQFVCDQSLSERHLVVWMCEHEYDLVVLDDQRYRAWHTLPPHPEAFLIHQTLEQLWVSSDGPLLVVGNEAAAGQLGLSEKIISEPGDPLLRYAAGMARRIARGEVRSDIDFLPRLDSAAHPFRSPLAVDWWLLRVAALLFLAMLISWQAIGWSYCRRQSDHLQAAQADIFRELFPNQRVPQGIRRRLESEQRRILGTRGQDTGMPEHPHVVRLLQKTLESLPTELRFRLLELRLEEQRLYLVGEVRSHSDADRIAAALRRLELVVSAPSTVQLAEKGVEFRLTANKENLFSRE